MKKGSTLVVTFDGLRRDRATAELMPNLAAFMQAGTNFINSRSIFPSETRVAVTSTVTGSPPRDHGLVANQYIHPAAIAGRPFQTARYEDLMAADAIGQLIDRQSLGERLAAAGKTMAVVSTASPGATWMMNHKARVIGHPVFSVYGEPISTPEMQRAAVDKFGPVPAGATPNTARLDYAAKVLMEITYPQFDPDLCIFWMSDPDSTSHAFGVLGAETEQSQRGADAAFGRIVAWWQSGQGPENLLVMSDHGQITGVRQTNPAEDLADYGDRLSVGSFNGLYLDDANPQALGELIQRLADRPYCGLIFAEGPDGEAIEGALPWSAVSGGHRRGATFGFTLRATPPATENASAIDACFFAAHIEPGGGMHGGLNRGELSTVLAANGPAFRQNLVTEVPCWLPDIAPTLLNVLGLPMEGVTGRVLTEALVADGRVPEFTRHTLSARAGTHEQYLEQWLVEGRAITDCGWTSGSGAWAA
ncbi:MAG TPA: alkaline phosphatase family protein [Devosiaceae bacterium]|nr:alkaline phosphatase family protein [Devosiaceae bacterium]